MPEENFLKQVILQLDFLGHIELSKELIDELKHAVHADFADFKVVEKVVVELALPMDPEKTHEKRSKGFSFKNPDTDDFMVLHSDSVIIDIKKYKSYAEFRNLVTKILNGIQRDNPSSKLSRLGFRYINQIIIDEGTPFEWDKKIKKSLTCGVEFVDKSELSRLMGLIELKKSNHSIRFHYGWFNSEYPNIIAKKEFLLDYDCYTKNEIEISSVLSQIDVFHNSIKKLFEDSISDELKNVMEA